MRFQSIIIILILLLIPISVGISNPVKSSKLDLNDQSFSLLKLFRDAESIRIYEKSLLVHKIRLSPPNLPSEYLERQKLVQNSTNYKIASSEIRPKFFAR